MERIENLKVSSKSNPNSVGGAIAAMMKEYETVNIQVVGAGALNQAMKGVIIARSFLIASGIDICIVPSFTSVDIEDIDRTGIKLVIVKREE